MKFYCGETWKAKRDRIDAEEKEWHDRFAWLPFRIGEEDGKRVCVWLETFQQRKVWVAIGITGMGWEEWEYRRKV